MSERGVLMDLRPLRESAPYRRVFVARTISILGIGLLMIGVPIQMYDLTGSSLMVGVVAAAEGGASIIGMLLGGVLADRYDRKVLILTARTVSGITFVGLAVNAGLTDPSPIAIVVLAVINGAIGSISIAALFAVVPSLVPRDQLVGVGALNVLSARVGGVVSPLVGGVIIAAASVEWNYWAAAIGTAVTVALLSGLPSLRPQPHPPEDGSPTVSVTRFLLDSPVVGGVMLAGGLAMLGSGLLVLVPGFVDERFGDDPSAAGLLYAAGAIGAVLATVGSGWIGHLGRPGAALLAALAVGFVVQAVVGTATALWAAVLLLVVAGVVTSIQEVLRYSIIQTNTPDAMLGRVNGLWAAQEVAGISVGSLAAGLYGAAFLPSTAVVVYSLTGLVLALVLGTLLGGLRRLSGALASAGTTASANPRPDPTTTPA